MTINQILGAQGIESCCLSWYHNHPTNFMMNHFFSLSLYILVHQDSRDNYQILLKGKFSSSGHCHSVRKLLWFQKCPIGFWFYYFDYLFCFLDSVNIEMRGHSFWSPRICVIILIKKREELTFITGNSHFGTLLWVHKMVFKLEGYFIK